MHLYISIFGYDHMFTAGVYNNLGILYTYMADFERAERIFKQAKEIYENFKDINNLVDRSGLVKVHNNLGCVYTEMGKYSLAKSEYKKAEKICVNSLPENHLDVAVTNNNRGSNKRRLETPATDKLYYYYYFIDARRNGSTFGEEYNIMESSKNINRKKTIRLRN